jgi:hypothetical protein
VKKKAFAYALLVALALSSPVHTQDLTTLLSIFLVDLRSGTWGASIPVSSIRVTNPGLPEYGEMTWASNFLDVGTVTNGGTARSMRLKSPAATNVLISPGGSDKWIFTSAGHITNNSTGVISSGAAPGTALGNSFFSPGVAFAALGSTATVGTMIYCTDCTPVTRASCPGTLASCVCAGSGTGSLAIRANTNVWYCPF